MRILVLSDTHGDNSRAYQVFDKLKKEAPVDLIILCGDYYKDAIQMSERTGCPMVWVKGNTDGAFSDNDYTIVDTPYGNLLVTHGHMENVDFSQQNLYYKTMEKDCIGALYGHTHRAAFTEVNGFYLMNPGSLTKPRDGSGGTFGIIVAEEDYFRGYIHRFEDFMAKSSDSGSSGGSQGGSGSKPKVQGGYLRSLLNYSDRF